MPIYSLTGGREAYVEDDRLRMAAVIEELHALSSEYPINDDEIQRRVGAWLDLFGVKLLDSMYLPYYIKAVCQSRQNIKHGAIQAWELQQVIDRVLAGQVWSMIERDWIELADARGNISEALADDDPRRYDPEALDAMIFGWESDNR
jgi:hypothetical protein